MAPICSHHFFPYGFCFGFLALNSWAMLGNASFVSCWDLHLNLWPNFKGPAGVKGNPLEGDEWNRRKSKCESLHQIPKAMWELNFEASNMGLQKWRNCLAAWLLGFVGSIVLHLQIFAPIITSSRLWRPDCVSLSLLESGSFFPPLCRYCQRLERK